MLYCNLILDTVLTHKIAWTLSLRDTNDIRHTKLIKLCKLMYSLQLCVDYVYKLNLYLTNTTLIYRYNLHIIV